MLMRLAYWLIFGVVWLWSLLPMSVLHLQARIAACLGYHVLKYRRSVVLDNLRQAFPDKTHREIEAIAKDFYLNLADVMVEIVKLMTISSTELKCRVKHLNPGVVDEMVSHGKGGIAVFGHFANWEWLGAGMGLQLPFSTVGVYKTQSSSVFDRLMYHIRTRHGNEMITMEQTFRESLTRLNNPCYIAFLGDQTPARHSGMFFTSFLGRPAPVHLGIATISLKLNVPVYYFDIRRKKRGFYEVSLHHIPHADLLPISKESVYELTDRHVAYLETVIRDEPSDWLWSHRRWKHSPREGDVLSPRLGGK
jgi:KDO2-lipid IV(A) lauroyltransferase